MASISVELKADIDERIIIEKLKEMQKRAMLRMQAHAVRIAPVDTGTFRASIRVEQTSEFEWEMRSGVSYDVDIEFGTAPHLITAKKAKALRFKVDGQTVFATRVQHPGTSGHPTFRPALNLTVTKDIPELAQQIFG